MKINVHTYDREKEQKEGLKLVVVFDDNHTPICIVQEYMLGSVNQYSVLTPADGDNFNTACAQLKLKPVETHTKFR